MIPFDRQEVKKTAMETLAQADPKHKTLVLIHTGAMLILTFALMLIDYLLSQKISTTGGLGGIGTRTTLTTIQSVLLLAQLAVIPFWQTGYTYLTLQLSKKEPVGYKSLLEGFLRIGPVFRLLLLQLLLYAGLALIVSNISSTIFLSTPWAKPFFDMAEALEQGTQLTNEALLAASVDVLLPLMLLFFALYLPAYAVVSYIYRLSMYSLLDDELTGALAAMRNSRILTRGHRLQLFKLDLSFWWFYLLEALISALSFLDMILPSMGIHLPIPAAAVTFVAFAIYAAAQLALYYWRKNEVHVTYAVVYNTLMEEE